MCKCVFNATTRREIICPKCNISTCRACAAEFNICCDWHPTMFYENLSAAAIKTKYKPYVIDRIIKNISEADLKEYEEAVNQLNEIKEQIEKINLDRTNMYENFTLMPEVIEIRGRIHTAATTKDVAALNSEIIEVRKTHDHIMQKLDAKLDKLNEIRLEYDKILNKLKKEKYAAYKDDKEKLYKCFYDRVKNGESVLWT